MARRLDPRQEVAQLREQLSGLRSAVAHQLRDNERIWNGFRAIEVRMIAADSLPELTDIVVAGISTAFRNVDAVSLAVIEPGYEFSSLLVECQRRTRGFVPVEAEWLRQCFGSARRPRLGLCPPEIAEVLFPHAIRTPRSMALAPLVLRGRLVGSLNQASAEAGHFVANTATDLLQHLAAVTALCVDNALKREQLRQDGLTDALTAVPNRRFFDRRLQEELSAWKRRALPLACLLVDLDHFKHINDRYGHRAGDMVLRAVAQRLNKGLRACDVLARWGGEEFALLLPNTDAGAALEVAERLRERVAASTIELTHGEVVTVSVSVGVACLMPADGLADDTAGATILDRADAALYEAKHLGRNRVCSRLFDTPTSSSGDG